jgi:nitroreductase
MHRQGENQMELLEAIKGRRSIRKYKTKPIPDEAITTLIEAGTYAPSAGNIQPWHFIIAKSLAIKTKLAAAAYNQMIVEQAPIVIVVCADESQEQTRYGKRGIDLYCLQDTAAATQNILLAAYSLGLGTCWIGAFNEEQAKLAINAPAGVRPVAIISVGHADVSPRQRARKPLDEVCRLNAF